MGSNLLFLCAEVMGYTMAGIDALVKYYNSQVYIVSWDKGKLTPYQPPKSKGTKFYYRSDFNDQDLLNLVKEINPVAIYVSGRMDQGYLKVARNFKGSEIKIVCGMDNQWLALPKQFVAIALSYWLYRRYFDYMWVAGTSQKRYAKLLGFKEHQIIRNVYTADVPLFHEAFRKYNSIKQDRFPHNFCFVGRFVKRKGLDILLQAFTESINEIDHDWTLTLIGQGELLPSLVKNKRVIVKDFLQPQELINEVQNLGVFCLPSRFEAWGVVLHEFAAAGLPLVCSDKCGAAELFVNHGVNGYVFKSESVNSLKHQLLKIISKSDQDLVNMGVLSNELANRITPKSFADSLFSIVDK